MRNWIFVLMLLIFNNLNAQVSYEALITDFYSSLNEGDSLKLKSYFNEGAFVKHIERDTSYVFEVDEFLKVCSSFADSTYQEEILHINYDYNSNVYGYVEYIEVFYKFYLNGEYHHCGVDQFVMSTNGYTPNYIDAIYSVPGECYEEIEEKINSVNFESLIEDLNFKMDDWHVNAADANFDHYFDFMAEEFYFLGTDPSERWSKAEFSAFCKPYFDEGSAWEFTSNWRNWYFSEDGKTAWFDESLNTWMEECRGTGVLQLIDGEWKIYHYNLTVLIENEKMKKFIKLRKK